MSARKTGCVIASFGRQLQVDLDAPEPIACVARGRKAEAVVGDRVEIALTSPNQGVIEAVLPRTNLLYRSDAMRSKMFAANITQLLIVIATQPSFADGLVGRALVAASAAGIAPVIVLNKVDLLDLLPAAHQRVAEWKALGFPVLEVSAKKDPEGLERILRAQLQDQHSIVMGQSGMGKSSIVNVLAPQARAATQEISMVLHSGKHTTTATRLYWLDEKKSSALIDSPGFQEFGLAHLDPAEIERGFPEFAAASDCKFYNCTHRHEPGCGILAALQAGTITPSRHALYRMLIEERAYADGILKNMGKKRT